MPSKWARLKGKFPRATGDGDFDAKVQLARVDLASLEPRGLAAQLLMLEGKKDLLEAWIRELNVEIAALNGLILDRWEADGVTSTRLDSGELLHERLEPLTSVADVQAWQLYLDAHPDLEYLYTVNHQSRNSFVKGLVEEAFALGREPALPPGLTMHLKSTVGIRRS